MTPRRTITRVAVAVALALSPALAACGDDAEDTAETTTTAEAPATEAPASDVTISDPWVRPVQDLTAMNRTAIYLQITGGAVDDALLSASVPSDVAATVEVHETVAADEASGDGMDGSGDGMDGSEEPMMGGSEEPMDGSEEPMMGGTETTMPGSGMMTMREVERIAVPAGSTVSLEPGGYHIMLLDVQQTLVPGDTVEVTLVFEVAGEVTVTAEVREP